MRSRSSRTCLTGIGRKRVYLTGAILTGVLAFPYFAVLSHGGYALIFIAIVLSLVVHAMQYGPQAALIGESFPTHLRYGGAGIGYQLASVFAGGPAPLVATWLLHETGTPYSISIYIVLAALVTVACVVALPDRSRANIDDAAVYVRASRARKRQGALNTKQDTKDAGKALKPKATMQDPGARPSAEPRRASSRCSNALICPAARQSMRARPADPSLRHDPLAASTMVASPGK